MDPQLTKEIQEIIWQHLDKNTYQAFIFGSRATGTNRKYSDIDIGIKGPILDIATLAKIKSAFEESTLPYNVDVVDFNYTSEQFQEVALANIIYL